MSDAYRVEGPPPPPGGRPPGGTPPQVIINNIPPKRPWLGRMTGRLLLILSLIGNLFAFGLISNYFKGAFRQEKYVSGPVTAPDKVALIKLNEAIYSSSVEAPIKELKSAQEDKAVKAVILRINSPGGEVFSTDRLYRAIVKFKKESQKPVIVLMESVAASGAFWISMPADKIIAAENCVTGSIGVVLRTFIITELLKEWGVEPVTFKTGELKDTGSFFREMTERDREELTSMMNGWYEQFIDVILKHRGEAVGGEEKLREVADGRVVLGPKAKELGFVDEIGYLDDAIEAAKELAGLTDEVRIVEFERQDLFGSFLSAQREAPLFSRETLTDLETPRLLAMPASFLTFSASALKD